MAPASALLQPPAAAPRVSAPPPAAEGLRWWPPLAGRMGPCRTGTGVATGVATGGNQKNVGKNLGGDHGRWVWDESKIYPNLLVFLLKFGWFWWYSRNFCLRWTVWYHDMCVFAMNFGIVHQPSTNNCRLWHELTSKSTTPAVRCRSPRLHLTLLHPRLYVGHRLLHCLQWDCMRSSSASFFHQCPIDVSSNDSHMDTRENIRCGHEPMDPQDHR